MLSSSSLTICIENAIELEANSISQIFISAQTNIAELNLQNATSIFRYLGVSLAIRATKNYNFKRKRSPWLNF